MPCNVFKKEALTQMFPYEFYEIFNNAYFERLPLDIKLKLLNGKIAIE